MTTEEHYDTLEKIGHGSFGIIRKVRRKTDGFIMCRKEISYSKMSQKEREQLHSEFQILSHLRHPNIVAYYHREHLKMSQDLYLYMEYCGNGDLGRVIKDLQIKGQRAPETFVWSMFSQLVQALYRCHYGVDPPEVGTNLLGPAKGMAQGPPKVPPGTMTILHRDLKPENVLLDKDNMVKLGDFGLSKIIKTHDFASTYVGTPFYMSPEISSAEKYTLKSDIWALGCVIYELCTRQPPFNANSHAQLYQKIREGKIAPLPDLYSRELSQVIKDCLKVDPDQRPETWQFLNLPTVKLMRKEKELEDRNKRMKAEKDLLEKKEKELADLSKRLRAKEDSLEKKEKELSDVDSSLRREWEVKAYLEIDRLAQAQFEKLSKQFDIELKAQVEAELQKKASSLAVEQPRSEPTDYQRLSGDTTSGDEFPSTTDVTDYSMGTPDHKHKEPRKAGRTPFGRAQTMFAGHAGTPMDIEMASPSPIAIASLSLSPRRTAVTKAQYVPEGNIFAANKSSDEPRWISSGNNTPEESDEEDIVPSPTRHIKSTKNPFTSKSRPVLTSQKSCPINRLKSQPSSSGLVSKVGLGQPPETGPRSPIRRLSKIPSAANLAGESAAHAAGLTRTSSLTRRDRDNRDSRDGEALGKVAAKNNIKGRTLVELQQARAGGRPLSVNGAMGPSSSMEMSPKRRLGERNVSRAISEPAAIWDPERDEMPSPFLVRHRRIARA